MNNQSKQMAAAMAGVAAYLQMEQEDLAEQMAAQAQRGRPAAVMNLWALEGRRSMMQLRNMMQLRGLGR